MSDIYDCAYIDRMRELAEINNYSPNSQEYNTMRKVNISNFSAHDLQIFVDSLDTIARLEHIKRTRRRQGRRRAARTSSKCMITCLDSSLMGNSTSTDENVKSLYASSESSSTYRKVYYGLDDTIIYSLPVDALTKESTKESNQTKDDHIYESIDTNRSRVKIISFKSLKSRLTSLFMKKKYTHPESPSPGALSSTTIGEDTEESEIYYRFVYDFRQDQFDKNTKKDKKKYAFFKKRKQSMAPPKAEETFLEKALRLLAL